ncbi:MAG: ABC transporter substrate-binding protein, partial [Cyclobacteriaceae bacterium]
MRRHIASGKVADLGVDKSMNTELALALDPDVVMAYSISGNNAVNQKLTELGVPVLINAEYLEEHPLGRAEWIKLAGLLFDKFEESDSIFRAIEKSYLDYASLLNPGDHRPTAFSGVLYGDTWFLPGGKNYASRIMDDAGIEYLWGNNPESGFLEISFESVLNKAKDADLWIGVAQFRSRSAMRKGDERYNLFSAFRD